MFCEVGKVIVKTRVCADETRKVTVKVSVVTDETCVLIDKINDLFVGTRKVIDRITDLFYETRDLIVETPTRQIKRSTYQIKYCKPPITADFRTDKKSR